MYALGIDLQRISLGALIIALGLLVDDAMITIESMVFRLERGDDKQQAAIFAYASTAYPRLTGTLVTIAGFVPVGFARSDAGEYTFSLFAVVALALLASWVVSGMCAPVVGVAAAAPAEGSAWRGTRRADAPVPTLPGWRRCGRNGSPFWSRLPCSRPRFGGSASSPSSSSRLPTGRNSWWICSCRTTASMLATRDVAAAFDKILAEDPDILRFSTYVGQGAIRFYLPLDVALAERRSSPSRSW